MRNVLLIVDDTEFNRMLLRELFSEQYEIVEAVNGKDALDKAKQMSDTIAVILLDLYMPEMDGFQVLEEMGKLGMLSAIPVIVITSNYIQEVEARVLLLGAADVIGRPFVPEIVVRRVSNVVGASRYRSSLESIADDLQLRLSRSNDAMIMTLTSIIEHRSLESGQHILRIRKFVKILLEQLSRTCTSYNLDEQTIATMSEASTLHDIGKLVIPDAILCKPARLTDEEFDIMRSHTTEGSKIVKRFEGILQPEYLQFAYEISRHHHERYDGMGYPDSLAGDEIPLCAQVTGVADAYDALTTRRVYKPAFSHAEAVKMIMSGECGCFSEEILGAFMQVEGRFEQLAAKYHDMSNIEPAMSQVRERLDMLHSEIHRIDHYKYLTALRIIGAIVVEIDYDDGTFTQVFPRTPMVDNIGSNGDFRLASALFIESYVNALDRDRLRADLLMFERELELGRMIDSSSQYRIYSQSMRDYYWYKVSFVRVDTQNPNHHKVLLVVKRMS